jgi:hypothetical protein
METSQKKSEKVEKVTASQTTPSICLPRVAWMLNGRRAVSKTAARDPYITVEVMAAAKTETICA